MRPRYLLKLNLSLTQQLLHKPYIGYRVIVLLATGYTFRRLSHHLLDHILLGPLINLSALLESQNL